MCDDSRAVRRSPRLRWTGLYTIAGLALALLAAAEALPAGAGARAALQGAVGFAALGAMAAWARANRAALDLAGWCDCAASRTTVRMVHAHIADPAADRAGRVTPWAPSVGTPAGRRTRAPSPS